MNRIRFVVGIGAIATLVFGSSPPLVASAQMEHGHQAEVITENLSSPRGLVVPTNASAIVGQGAFGEPGPVLEVALRGRHRGTATPITDPFALTDLAVSPLDGTGWGLSGPELLHQLADGSVVQVADFVAYQAADPDPVNQPPDPPEETNPYGLTVDANGDALVADAANNDVVRVTPDGVMSTVARFDVETISTDHLPPEFMLPPAIDSEAVPTTVTIGPDGAIYVGELQGFPFRPGTSEVWRIAPGATDAWCSLSSPDPDCTVYADGFTGIQDIAFNNRTGRLYVIELAADGVFAFEEGFDTGVFPPAVLLEVKVTKHGKKGATSVKTTELAAGQLSEPGGVAVAPNGKVYVTDGVFSNGRLLRIEK